MHKIIFPTQTQIFRHQNLLQTLKTSPVIEQKKLFNILDHIHFTNGTVLVHACDRQYGEEFLLQARLVECRAEEVRCLWEEGLGPVPETTKLLNLFVSDDLSLLMLPIQETRCNGEGFTTLLQGQGYLMGKRRVRRHPCRGIHVNLTQSGFLARGELLDFSPAAFHVKLRSDASGSFVWLNQDRQCMIELQEEHRTIFSGPCRCLRHAGDLFERKLVLIPMEPVIHRFQKRKQRSPRRQITPPLSAHFEHPFFGKTIRLDIKDLTFTGFAVEEAAEDSVLLPGLIIPRVEIMYAEALKMICDVQVIYRRSIAKGWIRSGLAILDMNFRTYRQLSHIMVHAGDPQARFSSDLEMESLWEFLFDAGFIYPPKYQMLQSRRDEFKETYRKFYQKDQDIEAHFTYQKNGRIYGHVSIFHAYPRSWMVQHLAARPLDGRRTGLSILKNVLQFFSGLYRYPSIGMDYMLFYFRPDNHFPDLFFGGFARDTGNPRACSLDLFTYLNPRTNPLQIPLPQGWGLVDFMPGHLPELERFYRNASGGLLLDALPFSLRGKREEPLEEVYRRSGLLRQWSIHALMQGESLKAVFVVNLSDAGLNLSELLNSIKVIVTDPRGLSWDVMQAALSLLPPHGTTGTMPLLIYPGTYPSDQGMKADKQYFLWILDSQYGKEYLEYMESKTRMTWRFFLRHIMRKLTSK